MTAIGLSIRALFTASSEPSPMTTPVPSTTSSFAASWDIADKAATPARQIVTVPPMSSNATRPFFNAELVGYPHWFLLDIGPHTLARSYGALISLICARSISPRVGRRSGVEWKAWRTRFPSCADGEKLIEWTAGSVGRGYRRYLALSRLTQAQDGIKKATGVVSRRPTECGEWPSRPLRGTGQSQGRPAALSS